MTPPTDMLRERFLADLRRNPNNDRILGRWDALALPDGWLVAGCLFQTVWNVLSGRDPTAGIKDYDLFYFDPDDLSAETEQAAGRRAEAVLSDLGIRVEVCNQARVHLWYERHFGRPYARLASTREGIDRFLMPATCVGVNSREVYAPHGFELLYRGELTMNPLTPYPELFERKAADYRARWDWLRTVRSVDAEP